MKIEYCPYIDFFLSNLSAFIRYSIRNGERITLTPMQKILVTLRSFALGCSASDIGDLCGFSQSTVQKIVPQVAFEIAMLSIHFIRMPFTPREIEKTQVQFYRISSMPLTIVSVDGTHIPIQSVGGNNKEIWRNRKNFYSINVQGAIGPDLRFLNIVARYPGKPIFSVANKYLSINSYKTYSLLN